MIEVWVASNGSDYNAGTKNEPFRTVQHAVDASGKKAKQGEHRKIYISAPFDEVSVKLDGNVSLIGTGFGDDEKLNKLKVYLDPRQIKKV